MATASKPNIIRDSVRKGRHDNSVAMTDFKTGQLLKISISEAAGVGLRESKQVAPADVSDTLANARVGSPFQKYGVPPLDLGHLGLTFPRRLFDACAETPTRTGEDTPDAKSSFEAAIADGLICRQLHRTLKGDAVGFITNCTEDFGSDDSFLIADDSSTPFTGCDVWIASHKEVHLPVDAGKRTWKPFD